MTLHRELERVRLFVNGTLMRGEPLHGNLTGSRFLAPARTAPHYRLLSVGDVHPAMLHAEPGKGVAVTGELYELDLAQLRHVLATEPPGLGVGVIELEDETLTLGILWTAPDLPGSGIDISAHGSWREYRATKTPQAGQHRRCGPGG